MLLAGWLNFCETEVSSVRVNNSESGEMALQFGVPPGSVPGPRIFVEYAADVSDIFQHHGVHHHHSVC